MTTTHDATAAPRGWPVHLGDPRPLLPGESRTFRIHWVDDDPDHRRLTLTAWNAPPISLFSGVDATGEPHVAPRDVTSHTTHTNS